MPDQRNARAELERIAAEIDLLPLHGSMRNDIIPPTMEVMENASAAIGLVQARLDDGASMPEVVAALRDVVRDLTGAIDPNHPHVSSNLSRWCRDISAILPP